MMIMNSGLVVGLGVFAAVVAVAGGGGLLIRYKIRKFSRDVFGTDSLAEGINRQADIVAETPKSVSSMTRLMEPQIVQDFPEFVWEEFKHKAENMLTSALLAISTENVDKLVEASQDVRNQISNVIEQNREAGVKETYRDIKIHQTEIANYHKENGKCIITIQSAVEYYHYKIDGERVVEGSKERKEQTKYNVELMYIQNSDIVEIDNAVGTTCPNCGAPIRGLGIKVCEYCGMGVTPINIKVWSLHKMYQVGYNK